MKKFDAIVIGAGSGLTISSYASSLGLKVAVVEKGAFGGTCLNRGCIPSKILIHVADLISEIKDSSKLGISAKVTKIDWNAIQKRVWSHIDPDAKSIEAGNKSSGISVFKGEAKFVDKKVLHIGKEKITAPKIFICAGTRPRILSGFEDAYTSDEIMRLKKLPKSMVIIGGGYIGCELGHFFSSLGTKVTMIVRGDRLINDEDDDVSSLFTKLVSKKYNVMLNTAIISRKGSKIFVSCKGKKKIVSGSVILSAVGRVSNSDRLNLSATGVKVDSHGYVSVDKYMETNVSGIYAIGDIAGKYFFKHSANLEASYAALNAFGTKKHAVDYSAMPHAIFANPQVASVGLNERDIKGEYEVKKYKYYDTGMGLALEEKEGFVKVLVGRDDSILGCHIIGPDASTLIHEVIVAMRNKLKASDIAKTIHIHPALSEVVQRAFNQ